MIEWIAGVNSSSLLGGCGNHYGMDKNETTPSHGIAVTAPLKGGTRAAVRGLAALTV